MLMVFTCGKVVRIPRSGVRADSSSINKLELLNIGMVLVFLLALALGSAKGVLW